MDKTMDKKNTPHAGKTSEKKVLETSLLADEQASQARPPQSSASRLTDWAPGTLRVIKRNGNVVLYNGEFIHRAILKAFLDAEGSSAASSPRVRENVALMTQTITDEFNRRFAAGGAIGIEDIQDRVELELMRNEHHKVARLYVLFREERAKKREARREQQATRQTATDAGEDANTHSRAYLIALTEEACTGLPHTNPTALIETAEKTLFDGASEQDMDTALVMSARSLVETEPDYSKVCARLLLNQLHREALPVLGVEVPETRAELLACYPELFKVFIHYGIAQELLDPKLSMFNLDVLGAALQPDNDLNFNFLGLQTIWDRYLLHNKGQRFELPQLLFMRIAMGLAIAETDREQHAIEFYQLMSNFDYMCSTPTLFNAGTLRPQLSSCYLTTVPDHLDGIYSAIHDNAMLSKWAGGLGNDWTPVRALGAYIKGTNGKSQGVVPFLKVANDTAVAVNQGGKRKGAVCAYLETWHLDLEEFLDLRKNTGDERRRTHDMNTANWIPDLFMERLAHNGEWTLFSPSDTPDLHDLTGVAFKERYEAYERMTESGEISLYKRHPAMKIWRQMINRLAETGHPWITFKDPCNLRSPQQHIGTVHSSNLCTEITLNTHAGDADNDAEIAVCNLGSINLPRHLRPDRELDREKLRNTVRTAMRMLDNVIDINYYSVDAARHSNLKHRPVGLGVMGYQDALAIGRIPFASEDAVEFSDRMMETISYFAIEASADLATERGRYQSFEGSLWSRGILPIDSIELLREQRPEGCLDIDTSSTMDWDSLREKVRTDGMRNSNVMAIAPTATIANIVGVTPSIEPFFQNLYTKSNLSGEFTVINTHLVRDLKALERWDQVMISDLKASEGRIGDQNLPEEIIQLYATVFEIDPRWLIEAAARRQKWIDQSQSLNLYFSGTDGLKLANIYQMAWLRGLKTTYYLRTMGATTTEKSTVDDRELNAVPPTSQQGAACLIDDPDCEACAG